MLEALRLQSEKLWTPSPAFYNDQSLRLATRLTDLTVFDEVFFTNTGAEANEGAIKLARKWAAQSGIDTPEIITLSDGFHGRTLATMSASGKPGWDKLFPPKVDGFLKSKRNSLADLESTLTKNTIAILFELVQGEAGVHELDSEFVESLKRIQRERNILLIADEVQTGIGRLGSLFAYEQFGLSPDIMTLGKGLGGGIPIAAMLIKRDISCFQFGDQGGTFNGNPMVCAVANAVLDEVANQEFLEAVMENGVYLTGKLRKLSEEFSLGAVRGRGLLQAIDLKSNVGEPIAVHCRNAGLLVNSPRPDTIRLMPALNVSLEEIDEAIELLAQAFKSCL